MAVTIDVPNGPIVVRTGLRNALLPPGSRGRVTKIAVGLPGRSLYEDATMYLWLKWEDGAIKDGGWFADAIKDGGWYAHTFTKEDRRPFIDGRTLKKIESMRDEFEVAMALGALVAEMANEEGK